MKKSHKIFYVCFVLTVFLGLGIFAYFVEGNDLRSDVHYVKIDGICSIEFLTNSKGVVVSFCPISEEGKVANINSDFIGLEVEDAVTLFLANSAKCGYIDVESKDNGVQVAVSSCFTQSFENKIYETCIKYFIENEIYCVVAESDSDRKLFEEKVANNVRSIEKLVVIESILERTNEYSFEYLNNNNESKLLDIVENLLNIDSNDYYNNKQYYVTKSNDILTQNIDKYNNHINNIDKISKSEFVLNYAKFVKSQTPTWELDFKKQLY